MWTDFIPVVLLALLAAVLGVLVYAGIPVSVLGIDLNSLFGGGAE